MESSRGGPLTTFIMMLPLIVVPAIAMLRPAGQEGSLLSELLSAATGENKDTESAPPTESGAEDALEKLFADDSAGPGVQSENGIRELDAALFAEATGNNAAEQPTTIEAKTQPALPTDLGNIGLPVGSVDSVTQQLLGTIQQMGVRRTLWFSPGPDRFGFVAFFRAGEGIVSYRFEAVADSRADAVQEVIRQAREWQGTQR